MTTAAMSSQALAAEALLGDDDQRVRAVLDQGITGTEHVEFVRRLQSARR